MMTAKSTSSAGPGLGFAYLMTGIAVGSIAIGTVFASIFSPDLVSTGGSYEAGFTYQHVPIAAYSGWIWGVIVLAMLLPTVIKGIRAKVTDRVAWTVLGLGVGGIWLAVMFVSIFAPVMVTGYSPWLTWLPLASILAPIAGMIVAGFLCKFVNAASFESPESKAGLKTPPAAIPVPMLPPVLVGSDGHTGDGEVGKLMDLAQLRNAGAITTEEYEEKKKELLARI